MKVRKYTKDVIEEAVKISKSWRDVCKYFKLNISGGSQSYFKRLANRYNTDYSHFTGRGWRKDKTLPCKKEVLSYCTENSNINSDKLRKKLIKSGYKKHMCEKCGLTEWLGEPAPLELDHINSNHHDNRIENLQVLCPNCHSLETAKRRDARKISKIIKKVKIVKIKEVKQRPRKVEWPSKEELKKLLDVSNFCKIGRAYGVSDNAVRKWAKKYNIL